MSSQTSQNSQKYLQYFIIDKLLQVINEGLLVNSSRIPHIPKNSRFYDQFKTFSRDQLGYKIFSNFRIKSKVPYGLRLSYLGNELLKRNFAFNEFNHDLVPTPKMYLKLDSIMQWPYYFTKRKIVLYSDEDVVWYKLNGNDLEAFLDVR